MATSYILQCPCRNIILYLDSNPIPQEVPFWLSENFKLPKGIGKATLLPIPGIIKQVDILCTEQGVEKDNQLWNCTICNNCGTFICTEKATGDSPLFVNLILQQKSEKETQTQQMRSSIYSPVWKIILKDDNDFAGSVLEPPDISDKFRYEIFKRLQTEMQQYLIDAEREVKKRISEFEQKQYEELRELQSRSIRDRKVLWNRIDQELSNKKNVENTIIIKDNLETIDSESNLDSESKENNDNKEDNHSINPEKKNTWKNSRIKVGKYDSGEWLFQFDDDDYKNNTKNDSEDLSADEIEFSDEEIIHNDSNDYHSTFQMAASLPVAIPSEFSSRMAKISNSPPLNKKHSAKKPLQSGFDIPEAISNDDQELLSKSFAIPKSRSRVRGW